MKLLKMADDVSWMAVDKFMKGPLCKDDTEDKRRKKAL